MTQLPTQPQQQTQTPQPPVVFTGGGIQLHTLSDAWRFAQAISNSGLAPKGMDRPEQILIAIQAGAEIGLGPVHSLNAFVVINGKLTYYASTALAKVRKSKLCKWMKIELQKAADGSISGCRIASERADMPGECVTVFDIGMAKQAGLWGKAGPWTLYPSRMLVARASGYHTRDHYSDVIQLGNTAEELIDMGMTPTVTATTDTRPQSLEDMADAIIQEPAPPREPGADENE